MQYLRYTFSCGSRPGTGLCGVGIGGKIGTDAIFFPGYIRTVLSSMRTGASISSVPYVWGQINERKSEKNQGGTHIYKNINNF